MQQQERTAKLMDWFAKAAVRHAEALEALQEDTAAIQVESLDRFYAALHREEGGAERFLTLLDHQDPAVAGMAAVYALREAPERSREVLARLAHLPGLLGFRAKFALDRWDSGEWPNERS